MAGREPERNAASLQQVLQTQHPEIGIELQNAINTLRKLQQITGSLTGEPVRSPGGIDASTVGRLDATLPPPVGAGLAGVMETQDSAPPRPAHEVRLLAERESFGRYQIVRLLGRGAMGAVYLAYDPQLERYVALKTPFFGDAPEIIQRFYREARAAAKLRSPFICTIYDVGQVGDIHYISMEFIEGESLGQHIRNRTFRDFAHIGQIVAKIARGLHKAHEQGVVHRDLKPDNVMLDADGEPIVMDFGLAREAKDVGTITSPGAILGTPAYMSPEQVEGDQSRVGPAADIYSLGVILFEMLTGRLPFQGSLMSVLRQIGNDAPPRPSALVPELPAESPLERICLKMMSKSPADRFSSMAEVADALERSPQGEDVPEPHVTWRSRLRLALLQALPLGLRQRSTQDRPSANAPSANAPSANAPSANAPLANAPSANAPLANAPLANAPSRGLASSAAR